jgi:Protein of unknown function (DUF3089)/Secretion system C-terminal sorting domain
MRKTTTTNKIHFIQLFFLFIASISFAQTDYNNLSNWAFHPNKTWTLIDGFNIDIAVIDEHLATTSVIQLTNNAMTDTGVDVFFIHPTILQNLASYTTIETVPIASQNTFMVASSIRGQAGLLSKYGRMFAPRYQQATPPTFLNSPLDSNQAAVLGIAYNDIKDAFLHYLNNYNNGNNIILASHSQGAYLAGFLLRDVFDSNPQLREKLVVAVVAGIASNYAEPNLLTGGWWQNIPFCSQQDECGCVTTWRSYKEGQIPPTPQSSHPCLNPSIVDNGWANSQLNLSQNWVMQDSLYYDDDPKPLRNFITLRSNVNYGGNVGYVAFDSLYSIRHQRSGIIQAGFVVQHTPKPNDQRPNFLLDEESNPSFSSTGYHQKDFNIYTWALLEQIDMKLALCATNLNTSSFLVDNLSLQLAPNPSSDWIYIKNNSEVLENEFITIIDVGGKVVFSKVLNNEGGISIRELEEGFYVVNTRFGIVKLIINR